MKELVFKRLFLYRMLFFCATIGLLTACNSDDEPDLVIYHGTPDYSNTDLWYHVPNETTQAVDVFFVSPTTYTGDALFCSITDVSMRSGMDNIRNSMASVYEETANLYMPYYSQPGVNYFDKSTDAIKDQIMREVPVVDIRAAFNYYLENYNNGRPFILAGYDQGSHTLMYLLEEIQHSEAMNRMVCAYLIGYSVTESYLASNSGLRFAQGRTDTKVIVSWNTESPDLTLGNPYLKNGAVAINPINWSRDNTYAPQESSLGARIEVKTNQFVRYDAFADARVNTSRGVVLCSTVDPEEFVLSNLVPLGVYHGFDYAFYYYDLQQNVKDRAEAFLQQ